MHRSTMVFLVLLRLAIGWHFLVEGALKLHSHYVAGETATNRPFSSAGYFREAPGPLGGLYRHEVGDADDEALARLTPLPPPEGTEGSKPEERMPPALRQEWEAYVDRFRKHYGMDAEQGNRADEKLVQAESEVLRWLTEDSVTKGTKETTTKYASGEVKKPTPTVQRVAEYRAKVEAVRETVRQKLPAFNRDVEGARLRQAKAEVAELRAGLLKDLNDHKMKLKAALADLLTDDQRKRTPMKDVVPTQLVRVLDLSAMWGLTAMGACLLIGLLTRLNCVLAAGFLAITYLAVPALPWLPAPPASEGTYLYVNKNVVEMLALLVLATTASGRWFGLDGIIHPVVGAVFGRRKAVAARKPAALATAASRP